MVSNTHCAPVGARTRRFLATTGLALMAALAISLVATTQAKAECNSVEECDGAANWERMLAGARFQEAVLYHQAADQEAARGNWGPAFLYRAAADQKQYEAALHNIAKANAEQRYTFFANLPDGRCGATACSAFGIPDWIKKVGKAVRSTAQTICKNPWTGRACKAVAAISLFEDGVRYVRYVWDLTGDPRYCIGQRAAFSLERGIYQTCTNWR